jgi:hypothetical protein
MKPASVLMLITAILEAVLGIPVLGGSIVIGFLYIPLFVMFVLHIISLVLVAKEGKSKAGNILGIITSCLAWIPFVGMALHIATAIVLFVTFAKKPAIASAI